MLASFADLSLNQEWEGQRNSHLAYEDALEEAGLKRKGERRDQTGGGGRTYKAWLVSLGLIFTQESTGKIKLTLAGEAIMNGDFPVAVLKGQILKYKFPSSFSIGRGVQVSSRFKIRPFRFLLKLMADEKIKYLKEEEIAKVIVTEAENESDKCYHYIVDRIIQFRNYGDACLEEDFFSKYKSSKGAVNPEHPYSHLMDLANTIINWLEYTQLVKRDGGQVAVLDDKREEVKSILAEKLNFIDRPEQHEYFQRKYGLDPKHRKDNRNLALTKTVTAAMIARQKIMQAYITESLEKPITKITPQVVDYIISVTGIDGKTVENVLVLSDEDGYQAILDNKAYHKYTISNDHFNRMVHNYIGNISSYGDGDKSLAFFSYIAGGFGTNIDKQLKNIVDATGVSGSAVSVSNMIKLVEQHNQTPYSHKRIKEIFSVNRQALLSDLA